MKTRIRYLGVAIVLAVLTACAPAYSHIYSSAEGGDNAVTAVSGAQSVPDTWSTSATHVTRNYHGATWTDTRTGGADGVSRTALTVTGTGTQNGMYGGTINYNDSSTLWDDWHYRSGLKIEQAQFVADRVTVRNEGDAVKFQNGASDVRLSRSWIDTSHDDCVQADYGMDGDVLEQNLMTNCYSAISARPSTAINASARTLLIDTNVVNVADNTSCYKPASYGCPNHAGWFKWESDPSLALRVALWNNTFVASSYPEIGSLALNAPVTTAGNGTTDDCRGNTLDFLGASSEYSAFLADANTWLARCPDTVINTGSAASTDYYNKVVAWNSAHSGALG